MREGVDNATQFGRQSQAAPETVQHYFYLAQWKRLDLLAVQATDDGSKTDPFRLRNWVAGV